MKLSEVEKHWKENFYGVENDPLDLTIAVQIKREPNEDGYTVWIMEETSNGYRGKVSSTQDVGEALRKYLEEEI